MIAAPASAWLPWALACAIIALEVSAAAGATTFYVDSQAGDDRAGGRSANEAWSSFRPLTTARLQPGDSILLRRGGTWTGPLRMPASGKRGAPITVGAYGTGPDPILTGGQNGIDANRQSFIVVRDLRITNSPGAGILAVGVHDWVIERVAIDHVGAGAGAWRTRDWGGVQWREGQRLTVSDCTFRDITQESVWAERADEVRILKNRMGVSYGSHADNMQFTEVTNYEIRDNFMTMNGPTNSGKGNLVISGNHGLIVGNVFEAGNFGLGLASSNTMVKGNRFIGHTRQNWSSAIILGTLETRDAENITIADNRFEAERVGVYLFAHRGDPTRRENINITNNVMEVLRAAVQIDRGVLYSGSFMNNTIRGAPAAEPLLASGRMIEGQWTEENNVVTPGRPARSR